MVSVTECIKKITDQSWTFINLKKKNLLNPFVYVGENGSLLFSRGGGMRIIESSKWRVPNPSQKKKKNVELFINVVWILSL